MAYYSCKHRWCGWCTNLGGMLSLLLLLLLKYYPEDLLLKKEKEKRKNILNQFEH